MTSIMFLGVRIFLMRRRDGEAMDHWTLHRHMFLGEISSGYGCLPCLVVMFQQWTAQFSFLIGRIQLSSKARNFRASIDALA